MEGPGTRADRDGTVARWALLGLLLAGTTNAVVAVVDAVTWGWWVAGCCLLGALLVGAATGGDPDGERSRPPTRDRSRKTGSPSVR